MAFSECSKGDRIDFKEPRGIEHPYLSNLLSSKKTFKRRKETAPNSQTLEISFDTTDRLTFPYRNNTSYLTAAVHEKDICLHNKSTVSFIEKVLLMYSWALQIVDCSLQSNLTSMYVALIFRNLLGSFRPYLGSPRFKRFGISSSFASTSTSA